MKITRKAGILLALTFALAALAFTGCPTEAEDDVLYQVYVDSLQNGTISVSPAAALSRGVADGTEITLSALPDPGHEVIRTSLKVNDGAVVLSGGEGDAWTFVIHEDVQVQAFFRVLVEMPIGSAEELARIGRDPQYPLDGNYYLTGDIDLAGFSPWPPIGTSVFKTAIGSYNPLEIYPSTTGKEFAGTFDGKNHTIRNLRLSGTATYSGLFGYTQLARIKDLTVALAEGSVAVSSVTDQYAGAVAGYARSTELSGIAVTGNPLTIESDASNNIYAGGVIGYGLNATFGEISSAIAMDITGGGGKVYAGGLVGYASASRFKDSFGTATGDVSASSPAGTVYAGGVVGYANASPIKGGNYLEGNVTIDGSNGAWAGGIAGYASSAISGITTGKVVTVENGATGTNTVYVGGIVGQANTTSFSISDCVSSGAVSSTGSSGNAAYGGGIAGSTGGPVAKSSASGTVTVNAECGIFAGGLVGFASGAISESSATGSISVACADTEASPYASYAGGLAGSAKSVARSFATGNVAAAYTGSPESSYLNVGGLLGEAGGTVVDKVSDSYATGSVFANSVGGNHIGGLVGNTGTAISILNCYAAGAVEGTSVSTTETAGSGNGAGGLVGTLYSDARVKVEYCAVLSPSITITTGGSGGTVHRVAGNKGTNAVLTRNYALDEMVLTVNENTVTASDNADAVDGASKTEAVLTDDNTAYSDALIDGGLGWDFDEIWKWDATNKRPILRWQE